MLQSFQKIWYYLLSRSEKISNSFNSSSFTKSYMPLKMSWFPFKKCEFYLKLLSKGQSPNLKDALCNTPIKANDIVNVLPGKAHKNRL